MTTKTFKLPDLGEGLEESEIVSWRVAVGDEVRLNQIIAEVETAKALVEVPSPFAGRVEELFAEAGSVVAVGAPIVAFQVTDDAVEDATGHDDPARDDPDQDEAIHDDSNHYDTAQDDSVPDEAVPDDVLPDDAVPDAAVAEEPAVSRSEPAETAAKVERELMLVGYGPPVEGGKRPKRRERTHLRAEPAREQAQERPGGSRRRSTPPVRRLAAELGIALNELEGTGEAGLVTREDVLAASAASAPPVDATAPAVVDREVRTPIRGVRKATAQAMVASAFTAPHATEFLTVDVTPTVELLERLRSERAFAGLRLTMLTVVAKALCIAVSRAPEVNSRWDDAAQEVVQYGYVNLGIAAATSRGLVVPNIKDADRMPLAELAAALTGLVETAKAGRSSRADLSGGTISITNIGVFGIDAGTPILNPGEAAILAMGAVRRTPWEYRGEIALRQVMTLSCSFDHRLVDGEQASRFLSDVGTILADPGMLLTMV